MFYAHPFSFDRNLRVTVLPKTHPFPATPDSPTSARCFAQKNGAIPLLSWPHKKFITFNTLKGFLNKKVLFLLIGERLFFIIKETIIEWNRKMGIISAILISSIGGAYTLFTSVQNIWQHLLLSNYFIFITWRSNEKNTLYCLNYDPGPVPW